MSQQWLRNLSLVIADPSGNGLELGKLLGELSQPTFTLNQTGKVVIDKHAGGRSPDRADALVIALQPGRTALEAWLKLAS